MENEKKHHRGWNSQTSENGLNWLGGPSELTRERQLRRKLSYEQLSDKVKVVTGQNITADNIMHFETNQVEPTEEQMQALAQAMDLPTNWFEGELA